MLRRRLMKIGVIPKFSVSDTNKVYFSKGNLQLTGENIWQFANNQWEYFGDSQSDNHRDLFGFGTGNNPNQVFTNVNYYSTFNDWGTAAASNIGTGWRTLSSAEWTYLFNTRTVNGGTGEGKSYTLGLSVNGVLGVVLYPDDYTGAVYSGSNWASFENAGCVFLPAAGYRYNASVRNVNLYGFYWSSTTDGTTTAYVMRYLNGVYPSFSATRVFGYSVRLVYDIKAKESKFVDLGLPSGTKWARMNVGASSETDYGNYYMYGMGSKTYDSTDTPYAGTEDPLNSSVDTATQVWGGIWHMPTRAQIQELIDNTTYQWVTNYKGSGINGGTFTAANGAVLFLPAAGYWDDENQHDVGNNGNYWGSSPDGKYDAHDLYFSNSYKSISSDDRAYGRSVRPVCGNIIPKLYDYLYEDLSFGAKDTTKTAIGICVIPGGILPDGKARFMSLKGMTSISPTVGGSDTPPSIYWGGYGSDIPSLTNFQTVVTGDTTATGTSVYGYVPKNGSYSSTPHIPSPIDYFSAYSSTGATSDLDGKANTEKILAVDNAASTAWQTVESITNTGSTATVHPAAQCCWRFNPGSTNQGDWYLPSIGELAFIVPNFNNLQTAISDVNGVQLDGDSYYWSSTEYGVNGAWRVYTNGGIVTYVDKNVIGPVRAFYKL